MDGITHRYDDLDEALDSTRALLERLSSGHEAAVQPSPQAIRHAQLVLHEWIANLIQHATFEEPVRLVVHVHADERFFYGKVVDTSEGFDLAACLRKQQDGADALPERGMGLRIIDACTDSYAYEQGGEQGGEQDDDHFTFAFRIAADQSPWLSTLF